MKNILRVISLGVFSLMTAVTFGQSLNINAGYSSSMIKYEGTVDETSTYVNSGTTYTNYYEYRRVNGFNAAIGYEFRLGNRLSLETGLKYQTRGYKYENGYSYTNSTQSYTETSVYEYKLNYLDLPIVLNTAILIGDLRVYARTGIYSGFLATAKYTEKSDYSFSNGESGSYEDTEIYKADDFDSDRITAGFVLGAGVEYKSFYFETNYNLGIFSINGNDSGAFTNDLSFSLGYKLKFGKE